ncbi:STAS domain-containing protein [Micromonospora sp. WMMD882]|uniref:STAS domain-containing protein n=1 Tax=Micromonospora sp. WMMD882 TaxID=3015151 RepID=UPI00248C9689|nr:STAS domain-containing protein [Micromonospora sp. WMMD882]WBB81201.1 STAS domain-containing protein [Micromonospora sp. WMMD882]
MPRQLLTIEVNRVSARHARLRLTGEIDFDTAPDLVRAAGRALAEGYDDLTVDLAGVTLCDSSGLSAFLVIHRSGVRSVRLVGINDRVQQLLARTGLAELLTTARTVDRPADDEAREVG